MKKFLNDVWSKVMTYFSKPCECEKCDCKKDVKSEPIVNEVESKAKETIVEAKPKKVITRTKPTETKDSSKPVVEPKKDKKKKK